MATLMDTIKNARLIGLEAYQSLEDLSQAHPKMFPPQTHPQAFALVSSACYTYTRWINPDRLPDEPVMDNFLLDICGFNDFLSGVILSVSPVNKEETRKEWMKYEKEFESFKPAIKTMDRTIQRYLLHCLKQRNAIGLFIHRFAEDSCPLWAPLWQKQWQEYDDCLHNDYYLQFNPTSPRYDGLYQSEIERELKTTEYLSNLIRLYAIETIRERINERIQSL